MTVLILTVATCKLQTHRKVAFRIVHGHVAPRKGSRALVRLRIVGSRPRVCRQSRRNWTRAFIVTL